MRGGDGFCLDFVFDVEEVPWDAVASTNKCTSRMESFITWQKTNETFNNVMFRSKYIDPMKGEVSHFDPLCMRESWAIPPSTSCFVFNRAYRWMARQ